MTYICFWVVTSFGLCIQHFFLLRKHVSKELTKISDTYILCENIYSGAINDLISKYFELRIHSYVPTYLNKKNVMLKIFMKKTKVVSDS